MKDLRIVPQEYQSPEWGHLPVPFRPWWARIPHPGGGGTLARRGEPGEHVTTPEEAIARDLARPLPHPGFRVGQIWALHWLQLTMVVGPLRVSDLVGSSGAPEVFFGPLAEAQRSLAQSLRYQGIVPAPDPFQILGTTLLADPCRPDVAPWTSPSKDQK
jgi:hypothetical protein